MKILLLVFFAIYPIIASFDATDTNAKENHKTLVIAVMDTGFGYDNRGHDAKLCSYGHRDFTSDGILTKEYATHTPIPVDLNKHGTNIVGLIDRQLDKKSNYCIVILKVFNKAGHAQGLSSAIRYATNLKAAIINYSAGGNESEFNERTAVENFIASGGILVAAGGNQGNDIGRVPYYPAAYPGVVSVANMDKQGHMGLSSNYGIGISRWEVGTDQEVYGIKMSGTSQATAVATGKIARSLLQ